MAGGISKVRAASEDINTRKESGGGARNFFKLNDGETAIVRFLEDGSEVACAWVHQLPPSGGRSYGIKVPCRDQDFDTLQRGVGERCPGCEDGLKIMFQGAINMIWRDAPQLKRDDQGRLVKGDDNKAQFSGEYADSLAVWSAGITVFEDLDTIDADFGGLTSRDFKITRRGTELNTKYTIRPANVDGGPSELSEADKALAEEKFDLSAYASAPEYDEWGKQQQSESKAPTTVVQASTGPFRKPRT
jgi:hypothetical protein